MSVEEIKEAHYSLPGAFLPKRIGDMDRDELLQVIAELRASEQWWVKEAVKK